MDGELASRLQTLAGGCLATANMHNMLQEDADKHRPSFTWSSTQSRYTMIIVLVDLVLVWHAF